MKSRQRRLRAIELSLTPQQVVAIWLRDALQAGTFEKGAQHSPPYRSAVANAVFRTVTESMKGQPEALIEQAIFQARQEADLLYILAVNANVAVMENRALREREYVFLLGYLSAEMLGNPTKERIQILRLALLMFLKSVIILDAAITQVVAERLNGQPILFRDCETKLKEQLQMAERLSVHFNSLAHEVGAAQLNLEELGNNLQSETEDQVSIWVKLARVAALGAFGTAGQMHAAMDEVLLFEPRSGEGSDTVDAQDLVCG
jgi:hypothetical protein